MFATKTFPDVFCFIDDGIGNQLMSVGTTSGSPILFGGPAPFHKLGFLAQFNSGSTSAGVATLQVFTATASNGTFASFSTVAGAISCSQSGAMSSAGKWFVYTELRGECLADLGTNGWWVKPIFVVAGVPLQTSLTTLGFLSGVESAQPFNSPTIGGVFISLLM